MKRLAIDVWSDIACPWCYVGKRRLDAALAAFPHRDAVDVTWHSFELAPRAPATPAAGVSYAERLARKYRTTVAGAEEMIARMTAAAAADGIEMRFDRVQTTNTFDAHRLLHFAAARDAETQHAMKERLLRAYMTEGELLGDHAVLTRLAGEVGLDAGEVAAMLAGDAYAADVRADERQAGEIGIRGVPFFVLGWKRAVSGAQPVDQLLRALERTWDALTPEPAPPEQGAACGVDGCD